MFQMKNKHAVLENNIGAKGNALFFQILLIEQREVLDMDFLG